MHEDFASLKKFYYDTRLGPTLNDLLIWMRVLGFKISKILTRCEANLDDITILQNCEYKRKVSTLHRFGIQMVHYIYLGLGFATNGAW